MTEKQFPDFDAVIFDLDGVITKTALTHAAAWKKMFDVFLEEKGLQENKAYAPFDEIDYLEHVDGKPRYDGIIDFLSSRGIRLPVGNPEDSPDNETVYGLGNRKNKLFTEILSSGDIKVFDSTIALIKKLRQNKIKTAIISSSKNCRKILKIVGITDLFDVRVDGIDSEKLGLQGKPEPDIFLQAARELDVEPEKAVVVEDAQSGVKAGQRGGFGCVIGVNRTGQAEALFRSGADAVVSDLKDISFKEDIVDKTKEFIPVPSAIGNLDEIIEKINDFSPVVFLDYDGTLTPIVRRPEDAILCEEGRRVVKDLAMDVPVAIVSGRGLKDVRKRVNVDRLY